MLASTCSIRRWIEALVKFLSRAFAALNLLPSMAATAWANRPSCRHRAMNWRQAPRIAGPLSFLKSAMVLKSGVRRPVSHISSTLRWVSRSSRRLDAIWFSWLVTEDGETKVGRGRAVPPGYFLPKTYCAAVIAEAWSFVHGVEPAPKNRKAAAAGPLFWRESLEGLSMEETKLALEWMLATDGRQKKLGRAAQWLVASFQAGQRASRVRDAQGNPPPPHGRQASSRDVCERLNRPEKPPI